MATRTVALPDARRNGGGRPSYIDWSRSVALRGLVAGRYQPLADGGAATPAPPDHACLLQSGQKANCSESETKRAETRLVSITEDRTSLHAGPSSALRPCPGNTLGHRPIQSRADRPAPPSICPCQLFALPYCVV